MTRSLPSTRSGRARGWLIALSLVAATATAALAQPEPQQAPATLSPALRDAVAEATVDAPPATLTYTNREIVTFRATLLVRTPAVRAASASRALADLRGEPTGPVSARPLGGGHIISIGSHDVIALVPADVDPAGTETLDELVRATVARLQQAHDEAVELRTPQRLAWAFGLVLLATMVLVVAVRMLVRVHAAVARGVAAAADERLRRLPGGDEIVRTARLVELLRGAVRLAAVAVGLFLLYAWLTFSLRRFPVTRAWGETLRGFMLERLLDFAGGIVAAIPDLFTVALVVLTTRVLLKILGVAFDAAEAGRLTLPGVYPETAQTSRRLVSALMWLFALALAFPYLPGSDTDAFKGVSVFVGLMVSLGSSGVVTQIMSGLTLTYSRALRAGDYVRIGDVEGTVTHLGGLSMKLRTLRNEEITIPNAVVVGNQTTNYSRLADADGVFTPTTLTIGYDTPWRQVEAMLLEAAARTPGLRSTPAPRVRQLGLRDFYVEYVLLVSLVDQSQRSTILDRLHGHIQDAFNERGVQIMSPNYEADPEAPKIVPRDKWFADPARADAPSPERLGS